MIADVESVRRKGGAKDERQSGETFCKDSVTTLGSCDYLPPARQRPDVLYLEIDEFMLELKEGSFENVGPPTKRGTAKLYDVEDVEAREFGDERVKLHFEDDAGSEVEVAVSPEQIESIEADVERVREQGEVFDHSSD